MLLPCSEAWLTALFLCVYLSACFFNLSCGFVSSVNSTPPIYLVSKPEFCIWVHVLKFSTALCSVVELNSGAFNLLVQFVWIGTQHSLTRLWFTWEGWFWDACKWTLERFMMWLFSTPNKESKVFVSFPVSGSELWLTKGVSEDKKHGCLLSVHSYESHAGTVVSCPYCRSSLKKCMYD